MSSRGTGKTKSLSAAGKTSHPGHTQHKTGSHKKSAGRARTKNGKNKNMEGNNLSAELAIIDLNDNNHPQNDDDQTSDPIDNPQTKSDNNNDVVVKDKIDIGCKYFELIVATPIMSLLLLFQTYMTFPKILSTTSLPHKHEC